MYRNETVLHLNANDFSPCKLVRRAGLWMDHMHAVPLGAMRYRWVLLWLDSIAVNRNVDLRRIFDIMVANSLDAASPSFKSAKDYTHGYYPTMLSQTGTGRLTTYVEFHFVVFSYDAYRCLQQVIDVEDNSYGWGVDFVFQNVCRARLGILDRMTMRKLFRASYGHGEAKVAGKTYRGRAVAFWKFDNGVIKSRGEVCSNLRTV